MTRILQDACTPGTTNAGSASTPGPGLRGLFEH
jgi:hypothetical protein